MTLYCTSHNPHTYFTIRGVHSGRHFFPLRRGQSGEPLVVPPWQRGSGSWPDMALPVPVGPRTGAIIQRKPCLHRSPVLTIQPRPPPPLHSHKIAGVPVSSPTAHSELGEFPTELRGWLGPHRSHKALCIRGQGEAPSVSQASFGGQTDTTRRGQCDQRKQSGPQAWRCTRLMAGGVPATQRPGAQPVLQGLCPHSWAPSPPRGLGSHLPCKAPSLHTACCESSTHSIF